MYEIEIKKLKFFSKTQLKINFLNSINSPVYKQNITKIHYIKYKIIHKK